MAIARISEFESREGKAADLRDLLATVASSIREAPGCRQCQLLRNTQEAGRMVIYELWDDEASHRAATQTIPKELMQQAMALLAGPPKGAFYRLETDG